MLKLYKTGAVAGALVIFAAGAPLYALAQQSTTAQQTQSATGNVNLDERALRGGMSVDRILGMKVRGKNRNDLGEVEHVLVNDQGKVSAIIVESGGFMNIGDTHFRVPWNEVQFSRDMDHVVIPLSEQTVERYRDRRATERVQTGPREFRVSTIRGGGVTLRDGTRYGQVEDMIVTRNGDIKAVIVDASFGPGGQRAIPYQAGAFDFERNVYAAPFDRNQADTFRPFDYRASNVAEPVGATGATGGAGAVGDDRGVRRAPRQSRG